VAVLLDSSVFIQELPGSLYKLQKNHQLLFSENVVVLVTQHFSVIDVAPFDMN